jgi:hypothetical protein
MKNKFFMAGTERNGSTQSELQLPHDTLIQSRRGAGGRGRTSSKARWWFRHMHSAVDAATPSVTASSPQQAWMPLGI